MLRCTGRAYPVRPIRARPGRSGRAHLALPRPRLSQFLLLRGRRAEPRRGPRLQHRPDLDLPRSRWRDPGRSGTPDPFERALDAPGLARPGAVHLAPGRHAMGVGPALRAHRIRRRAADLGDGPGCSSVGQGRSRRRHPRRRPRAVHRVHGPAGQLLAVPAARPGSAVDGRARAQGIATVLRSRGTAGRSGDPVPQRRVARPRLRSGSHSCGIAGAGGPSHGRLRSHASGSSSS